MDNQDHYNVIRIQNILRAARPELTSQSEDANVTEFVLNFCLHVVKAYARSHRL